MPSWTTLRDRIPVLDWMPKYAREWFRQDVIAGVTAAAVIVPKAMAFASIAGLPIQAGLLTAIVPVFIYALFGTSRVLSVSTTTTVAIMAGVQLSRAGAEDSLAVAAATLAVVVGMLLILAHALRLGFLANFISDPVLTGFKTGVGIVIIFDQIPKLLGIHIQKASLLRNVLQTASQVTETFVPTLLLGVATLALIFILLRYFKRAPAPLIAMAVGITGSWLGLHAMGVETVGVVKQGLPELTLPDWSIADELWPSAAGIALISYTESVAAMRAFARTDEPRPEPNQELFALGLANIGAGLLGSMPAGGGATQTAVNRRCGARTQLSGIATATVALLCLLVFAPIISYLPHATLAAIVIVYSIELISVREFMTIRRVRSTEFWWAVIAVVGILLLGTVRGILVAVLASMASLIQQSYNAPVYAVAHRSGSDEYAPSSPDESDIENIPGLQIVRVEGRIYFANAERVADKLYELIERHRPQVVILDCRAIFDLEFTAAKVLEKAEAAWRAVGISLWIVAPNPGVREMLERAPLGQHIGKQHIFQRLHPTVEQYKAAHH